MIEKRIQVSLTFLDCIYFIGGYLDGVSVNNVDRLNLNTRITSPIASLPKPMDHIATAISESEIFAIGYAGDESADSHCVVLDVGADKYAPKLIHLYWSN